MKLILLYSLRNLVNRKLTTILTASGMALVILVFSAVLMLSEGLRKTLVKTGTPGNVVVIRKSSGSEVQSGIEKDQARIIEVSPEISLNEEGKRMVSKELVVLIGLPKKGTDKLSNVVIRGIMESSLPLRSQVKLKEGRMIRWGSNEIIVGNKIADNFDGVRIGNTLNFGQRQWLVVGIFEGGTTGFSSEIWADVEQLKQAFRRPNYSSMIFKLSNAKDFDIVKDRLEKDPRLTVEVKREIEYYEDQSAMMAKFIKVLGVSMTVVFSIGAILGAMITMYSAVAQRKNEIGTLRALGFQKTTILTAFLVESLFLSLIGCVFGLFLSSFLQLYTISTMNWQTFSELAFSFTLTPKIILQSLLFSVIMGSLGGLIPALRASRQKIVDALRTD
ncbi:MAG: ABC transporter permease [Proteobacteria bacterium]|nr:ABC transporter permease [Pseudomonadota bacterium]